MLVNLGGPVLFGSVPDGKQVPWASGVHGEALISELHGHKVGSCMQPSSFIATTTDAASQALANLSSNRTVPFGLFNPRESGVLVEIIGFDLGWRKATIVAVNSLVFGYKIGVGDTTIGPTSVDMTVGTVTNTIIGSTARSRAICGKIVFGGSSGAPVVWGPWVAFPAVTGINPNTAFSWRPEGKVLLAPGTFFSVYSSNTNTLDSSFISQHCWSWTEWPL